MKRLPTAICIATVAAVVLAGCGRPDSGPSQDLLFLGGARGVSVVPAGADAPSLRAPRGLPSPNWSTVVRTERHGDDSTYVVALNPSIGTPIWARTLEGRLRPKVVSDNGDLVALGPNREAHYLDGRSVTQLVVAGSGTVQPQALELRGNFEPEAFSTDGRSLFVVQYLPAADPDRYRVRRLDIGTGVVHDVYTPDAELQRAMRGTARIQAMSEDGRRLYTLYTIGSGSDRYAFIHVLSLDELWAHCVDLSASFAAAAESATALALNADGSRLYVTNTANGVIAEIDTERLQVVREAPVDFDWGRATVADHGAGLLYVANGRHVTAIGTDGMLQEGSWFMDSRVNGLQVGDDGKRVYVGLRDRVIVLDTVSGKRLGSIDPPGIGRIQRLGGSPRPSVPVRQDIVCAC